MTRINPSKKEEPMLVIFYEGVSVCSITSGLESVPVSVDELLVFGRVLRIEGRNRR